ncbi:hypothetical protein F5Y13DRAFT_160881 [Hypoxylon sp. FL1857]|nr:hypothetical protein F5Y13DRAFT_160881 [Hypoxylon sp. FL1857]
MVGARLTFYVLSCHSLLIDAGTSMFFGRFGGACKAWSLVPRSSSNRALRRRRFTAVSSVVTEALLSVIHLTRDISFVILDTDRALKNRSIEQSISH